MIDSLASNVPTACTRSLMASTATGTTSTSAGSTAEEPGAVEPVDFVAQSWLKSSDKPLSTTITSVETTRFQDRARVGADESGTTPGGSDTMRRGLSMIFWTESIRAKTYRTGIHLVRMPMQVQA